MDGPKDNYDEGFKRDVELLKEEYDHLLVKWQTYRSLFTENKDRISLLNECSGPFFGAIQDSLADSILQAICRLIDPIRSGKGVGIRENLTFRRISKYLDGDSKSENELQDKLDEIKKNAAFAIEVRNKRVAHTDYSSEKLSKRLSLEKVYEIQCVVDGLGALFNWVYYKCFTRTLMYNFYVEDAEKESDCVIRLLYDGLGSEKQSRIAKFQALKEGRYDDANSRPTYPKWLQ